MTDERDSHFAYNLGSSSVTGVGRVVGYFWQQDCEEKRSLLRRPPTRKVTRSTYLRASGGGGARSYNSRVGWRAADWRQADSTECRRLGSSSRPRPSPLLHSVRAPVAVVGSVAAAPNRLHQHAELPTTS